MQEKNVVEILLVEDNQNDIELIMRSFKKHNLANRVLVVNDGEQALEYIFVTGPFSGRDIKDKPKVIILDLKLPKIDGLEVLRRIKYDERTKMIPVVILTSSKEEKDVVESYRLGVNSYIVKPVDYEKFMQSVADLGLYWLLMNQPPAF
jgi:CheY-like chemotaxis protein